MKNLIFGLFCFVCFSFIFQKKQPDDDVILWSSVVKLKWDNFKGVQDTLSKYKAVTSTNIKTKANVFTEDLVDYNIMCLFEKNKSWTKDDKSNSLLQHEQIHFDIAELVTRKLRKKFLNHKFTNLKGVNDMITQVFQEAIIERRAINKTYDTETNHSIIVEKQKEWELKIANELKGLEQYASTKVVIKREKKK